MAGAGWRARARIRREQGCGCPADELSPPDRGGARGLPGPTGPKGDTGSQGPIGMRGPPGEHPRHCPLLLPRQPLLGDPDRARGGPGPPRHLSLSPRLSEPSFAFTGPRPVGGGSGRGEQWCPSPADQDSFGGCCRYGSPREGRSGPSG